MTARRSARTRAPPAPVTDHVVPAAAPLALGACGERGEGGGDILGLRSQRVPASRRHRLTPNAAPHVLRACSGELRGRDGRARWVENDALARPGKFDQKEGHARRGASSRGYQPRMPFPPSRHHRDPAGDASQPMAACARGQARVGARVWAQGRGRRGEDTPPTLEKPPHDIDDFASLPSSQAPSPSTLPTSPPPLPPRPPCTPPWRASPRPRPPPRWCTSRSISSWGRLNSQSCALRARARGQGR